MRSAPLLADRRLLSLALGAARLVDGPPGAAEAWDAVVWAAMLSELRVHDNGSCAQLDGRVTAQGMEWDVGLVQRELSYAAVATAGISPERVRAFISRAEDILSVAYTSAQLSAALTARLSEQVDRRFAVRGRSPRHVYAFEQELVVYGAAIKSMHVHGLPTYTWRSIGRAASQSYLLARVIGCVAHAAVHALRSELDEAMTASASATGDCGLLNCEWSALVVSSFSLMKDRPACSAMSPRALDARIRFELCCSGLFMSEAGRRKTSEQIYGDVIVEQARIIAQKNETVRQQHSSATALTAYAEAAPSSAILEDTPVFDPNKQSFRTAQMFAIGYRAAIGRSDEAAARDRLMLRAEFCQPVRW
jgi:hypothetical protein